MRVSLRTGIGLLAATGTAVALLTNSPTVDLIPSAAAAPTVAISDIKSTLNELQKVADANGGTRRNGSAGYTASADYIAKTATAAGLTVTKVPFNFQGTSGVNVIADLPGGDENDVTMFGAHLDSVPAGAGLTDNASGSAAVMAVAIAASKSSAKPKGHLRFAWWDAEETGLRGSLGYLADTKTDKTKIKRYLNFDMVGQFKDTKTVWGLYGKGATEKAAFVEALKAKGFTTAPEAIAENRSDQASFERAGIPTAGLAGHLDGADGKPGPGGTAGCYHQACDKLGRVDPAAVEVAANAAATALYKLAG
ncbi:M20/M25/M40 family metallo-hydrolase [Pseudonocardiaceae bacterium YIM PH 21723]|nr:M20/M25/M40 family metallo-hydrolase [Pseudonocardiaceae bacterium YIM PH 21723]